MDSKRIPKAIRKPVPELMDFLKPYREVFGREEPRQTLERYITGLLSDLPRKNGQTIGEYLEGISYHRIYQFLVTNRWDEQRLESIRIQQLIQQTRKVPTEVRGSGLLIFDDTGLPKQGRHSVGVARQYSGTLGKVGNCQVVVSAYYSDDRFHWPVTNRLYLPQKWVEDSKRRAIAQIPADVSFQTKPEIALDLVDWARKEGVPFKTITADAGYGGNPGFLEGLETRGLPYVVAVPSNFGVRTSNETFHPAYTGRGRPPKVRPASPLETAKDVLDRLPEECWQTLTWGEGSQGLQTRRIAVVRMYRAHGDTIGSIGWLIGERPLPGHDQEEKIFFSTLPEETPVADMVRWGHRRWAIERYFQDAKELCGMDEYQGRHWQGLHRHLTVVNLAYTWLLHLRSQGATLDDDDPPHRDGKGPASFPGPSLRATWRWWLDRVQRWVILFFGLSADTIRRILTPILYSSK